MKRIMKKIVAFVVGIAGLLTAIPCSDARATEETSPSINVTSTTVTAGNYAYFYVNATDFTDLVGLEFSLLYDADVMSVNWVSAGSMISSSTVDINKDTAGEIKCSVMNIDGLNGNGQLLRMGFTTSSSAEEGTYPITLIIGEAYDLNFTNISITKTSGNLTLQEASVTATSISFSTTCSQTTVKQGDNFTYTLKSTHSNGPACGNFEFRYDRDLLELADVTLGSKLLTETAIYSINTETAGYVKISYADIESLTSMYGKEYAILSFTVKENVSTTTSIEFSANSLVDANLANMKTKDLSQSITIEEVVVEVTYPAIKVVANEVGSDRTFTADVIVEEGTNIAAGDFTITYDKTQILCIEVKADSAVSASGGFVITKEEIGEGTVVFSYVNTNPYEEEQRIVVLTFEVIGDYYGDSTISINGKDVVDSEYNDVIVEYEPAIHVIPKKQINSIEITDIQTPCVGETLDTEIACNSVGIQETYTVLWNPEEETVSADVNYTVNVKLLLEDAYECAESAIASVNGNTAQITENTETYIVVSYTFGMPELAAPKNVSAKLYEYNAALITWTEVEGATGYYVYSKATGQEEYTYIGEVAKTYYCHTSMTEDTVYEIKIVACRVSGDEIIFDEDKSGNVRVCALQSMDIPEVSRYSTSRIKVEWNMDNNVTGYQISISAGKDEIRPIYTCTTNVADELVVKVEIGCKNYVRVRSYVVVDGIVIYTPWTDAQSIRLR